MCGIFFSLSRTHHIRPSQDLQQRLNSRGPDSTCTLQLEEQTRNGPVFLTLCATVLSLRGLEIVAQPIQDEAGQFFLCWNGEAWSIGGKPPAGNDTEAVLELLKATTISSSGDESSGSSHRAAAVASALSGIAGPYAFAFYDRGHRQLFLGRDFLGRRSLLYHILPTGDLMIASVSDSGAPHGWVELDTAGVHCINLHASESGEATPTWDPRRFGHWLSFLAPYTCCDVTSESSSPARCVVPRLSLNKDIGCGQGRLRSTSAIVAKLEELLFDSLSLRVCNLPDPPQNSGEATLDKKPSKFAILFSGGLDCTVLARMSHDLLPRNEPIELINAAFENRRIHKEADMTSDRASSPYEVCPDRVTGRRSYTELQQTCPGRQWRFVAVNVPYIESQKHKDRVISLMHPHNTEMDLSISLALYFAARGRGEITSPSTAEAIKYTTSARVLLSGLGADELFGGYTRHSTAFRRGGRRALIDELELDVSRLGKRNLGRDDRVMSHWGREVRFPYLDEQLLSWALAASVTEKCGFGEPESGTEEQDGSATLEPGKKVLRCLAWKLGMEGVASEKKRAIQFGARTAKMETGKTKGTQLLS